MTNTDRALEEVKANDSPPLNPAARERLGALLDEITDMNIALGRLFDADSADDIPAALQELRRAMDTRLAKAMNIVAHGNEEG